MKKELQLPVALGFCKKCFRLRRHGSSYCGQCQNETPRMKVYTDSRKNFPLVNDVVKRFDLKESDVDHIVFTYGDTIYTDSEMSVGLIAHELTHVFQQTIMGKEIWWHKYLTNDKFRMEQELSAYRQQYAIMAMKNKGDADMALQSMARDLSSKIYGNFISYEKALTTLQKLVLNP
jgi:uncharacterized protein YqgQ